MTLPDQERLGRFWILSRHLDLETRSVTGIDLVVPSATETPFRRSAGIYDLACHLVCGRSFPTSWLEVQVANLPGGPILDLHQSIVVHRGVSRDDAHNGRGNLLPSVELLSSGNGTQLQEPSTQKVDIERFAVEFRLESRFTLCKGIYVSLVFRKKEDFTAPVLT